MTQQDFLQNFYCKFEIVNQNNFTLVAISKVIRRSDGLLVDQVSTTFNIQETIEWIIDSHSAVSLIPINWNDIQDETKRVHLGYFAQRCLIENFYPRDSINFPDISNMYQ
ncbi:MAG: hypothetical protein KBB71_04830 [Lentimicrobiaceae bacterium]|nr:hypothetical protein [Lentimicrobiaceae bacterium]